VDDIAIQTDVSVGIALFPEHGSEVSTLLRRADIAMYKAKNARTGHHVYEFSDDGHGPSDREELRVALDSAELVLHYQPKVDLGTGTCMVSRPSSAGTTPPADSFIRISSSGSYKTPD
jgi:predicted signal transduction protein with EAL and GGDEF domain